MPAIVASSANLMEVLKIIIECRLIWSVVDVSRLIFFTTDDGDNPASGVLKPCPLANISWVNWLNQHSPFTPGRGLILNSIRFEPSLKRPFGYCRRDLIVSDAAANKKGADSFVSAYLQSVALVMPTDDTRWTSVLHGSSLRTLEPPEAMPTGGPRYQYVGRGPLDATYVIPSPTLDISAHPPAGMLGGLRDA